jgi:hypothetical protein
LEVYFTPLEFDPHPPLQLHCTLNPHAARQILDQVDEPCRRVDFLKGKGDPAYIEGVGYPCFGVSGIDVSRISKRDLGMTLNIIITYKNKCEPLCAIACLGFCVVY